MKKTLVFVLFALLISSLFSFEFSGDFRTRYSWTMNWFDADRASDRFIDARARVQFEETLLNDLNVIYRVRGDYNWGEDVKLYSDHLYIDFTGFTRTSIKLGRLPWADEMSLVFDDDLEGIFYRHEFCNYSSIEAGYGLLKKKSGFDYYDIYGNYYRPYNVGADNAIYFFGIDREREIGFQTIVHTFKYRPGDNRVYRFWAMPYLLQQFGRLSFDAMLAYNGNFTERRADAEKNTINHGLALALDLELDAGRGGKPGLNVLVATGDDNSDYENTTYFNTIANDYHNGLELLGRGAHDDSPRGDYSLDPFNSGHGLASVVGRYSVPLCEKISLRFAGGAMSALERGLYRNRRSGKIMGGEINMGAEFKINDDISIKAIGAYATQGGFFGPGLKDVYGIHSTLDINF